MIKTKCLDCGKSINKHNYRFKTYLRHFCNTKCYHNFEDQRKEIKCLICGKSFLVKQAEIRRGGGKYCSRNCYYKSKSKKIIKKCPVCLKEFVARIDQIHCSRRCMGFNNTKNLKHYSEFNGGSKASQKRAYLKIKQDPKLKLNLLISCAIRKSLKNGEKRFEHWEKIVGYNLNQIYSRLNKTMPQGYSWNDYLNGKLHIDHLVPIVAFNFTSPNDLAFKQCWALSNLRLLPAKENLSKGAKLIYPFTPPFPLAVNQ